MKKKHVVQTKQVNHVLTEKNVLEAMNFPFFVNCKYAFQNNSYLCFVMPYINGGEMFTYLKRFITNTAITDNNLLNNF